MLKKARVAVSAVILLLFLFVLLEVRQVNVRLSEALVHLQLFPVILKSIFAGMLHVAAILLLLLLLAFLFGRVYCSGLCPLGALQDVFIYARYKYKRKKAFRKAPSYRPLRYTVLAATLILTAAGNMALLNILEPYSNFARIAVNLLKPPFAYINNTLSYLAGTFDMYSFPVIKPFKQDIAVTLWAVVFLAVLGAVSYFRGRLFCNTLCPAGAMLGLFARFSVFKIRKDASSCVSCGLCASVCKAECIDPVTGTIDNEKCVACFNCVSACRKSGLFYGTGRPRPASGSQERGPEEAGNERRAVIKGAGSLLLASAFSALGAGKAAADALVPVKKMNPVITPPGSQGIEHFTRLCTACHLCVTACPQKVLAPAFTEYGLSGIMQPKMDFSFSYCLYKCNTCSLVCPTGAIKPLTVEEKKLVQIGKVNLIKSNCLVYDKKIQCNVCVEHCPTKAVHHVAYQGLLAPEIKPSVCIGCGACENTCPAKPNKAIFVDGNPVHLAANTPSGRHGTGGRRRRGGRREEDFPF